MLDAYAHLRHVIICPVRPLKLTANETPPLAYECELVLSL